MRNERRPPPPLDAAALDRMALRYVERYATTRAKLAAYLARKVRERGWDGPAADIPALVARMAELRYVDDAAFAEAKAAAMARRGLGARRVREALRHAGVGADDSAALAPEVDARSEDAAMRFARRKRIGPYASVAPDRALLQKQIAAMLRAGHAHDVARRIASMPPASGFTVPD